MKTSDDYANELHEDIDAMDNTYYGKDVDRAWDAMESTIREAMNDTIDHVLEALQSPSVRGMLSANMGVVRPDGTTTETRRETTDIIWAEKAEEIIIAMKDVRS